MVEINPCTQNALALLMILNPFINLDRLSLFRSQIIIQKEMISMETKAKIPAAICELR